MREGMRDKEEGNGDGRSRVRRRAQGGGFFYSLLKGGICMRDSVLGVVSFSQ